MNRIKIFSFVGEFAEDKDKARDIRVGHIIPLLEAGKDPVLDFDDVGSITQSFAHALLSDLIRNYGIDILDRISFANCNETVQKIVGIVTDYMQ